MLRHTVQPGAAESAPFCSFFYPRFVPMDSFDPFQVLSDNVLFLHELVAPWSQLETCKETTSRRSLKVTFFSRVRSQLTQNRKTSAAFCLPAPEWCCHRARAPNTNRGIRPNSHAFGRGVFGTQKHPWGKLMPRPRCPKYSTMWGCFSAFLGGVLAFGYQSASYLLCTLCAGAAEAHDVHLVFQGFLRKLRRF
jgi:hypothetical protein